jgi:hypothetical protein
MPSEYRHAPVLSDVLQLDPTTILRILVPISQYSCFPSEFTKADGPQLLPPLISRLHLEEVTEMIIRALSASKTYLDICLWLTLFIDCLISVGTGLKSGKTEALIWSKPNLLHLVPLVDNMAEQRGKNRQLSNSGSEPKSTTRSTPSNTEAATKEALKCDASLWSPKEWDDVQYLMERLTSVGLRRGYVIFDRLISGYVSFERLEPLARDPDGLCSHPRYFDRLASGYVLFERPERFARDPDGLCLHPRS